MKYSVLIVDDEPNARNYLKKLLAKDTEVQLLGECKNGREAADFFKHTIPQILFLDIQMPGMTGIELAHEIDAGETQLIFTTAYNQFAVQAFEIEAQDYLLKPFDETRFFKALNRAKEAIQKEQQIELSERLLDVYSHFKKRQSPFLTELILKEKGFEKTVQIEDICAFEADSVYAKIHLNHSNHLYRVALSTLEEQLPEHFIRVHRAYIINKKKIQKLSYLNNNTFEFSLTNSLKVTSSRSYKNQIKKSLESE